MRTVRTKEDGKKERKAPVSAAPGLLAKKAAIKVRERAENGKKEDAAREQGLYDFASEKMETMEEKAVQGTEDAIRSGTGLLVRKVRERQKTKEQRAWHGTEHAAGMEASEGIKVRESGAAQDAAGRRYAGKRSIKERPVQERTIRTAGKKDIKGNLREVRIPAVSEGTLKQNRNVIREADMAKAGRQLAIGKHKDMQEGAVRTAGTVKQAGTRLAGAIKRTVTSFKEAASAFWAAGGACILFFVIVTGIIGGIAFMGNSEAQPLSQEVLAHTPALQRYAAQYGIPEYVPVLQAIMMQESGGQGTDPMQSSECPYNTRFPHVPNAITDADYSIQTGVEYYASCLAAAGCESPQDMERLKLSLQGYNFGNGYIPWAIANFGGYSEANALQFSQEQAARLGWESYGDVHYVSHVLRYYSGGSLFAGLFGNEQIVSVALSEVGNRGGEKFWSWYGFQSRVAWCACFVSWCSEECGLIENGSVPRFSLCADGVNWFKEHGKWQERGYVPSSGTLIFFDWMQDGVRDGVSDHVGIVEKCEGGRVYTVEGNSSDAVRQRSYGIDYESILGYGLIHRPLR